MYFVPLSAIIIITLHYRIEFLFVLMTSHKILHWQTYQEICLQNWVMTFVYLFNFSKEGRCSVELQEMNFLIVNTLLLEAKHQKNDEKNTEQEV